MGVKLNFATDIGQVAKHPSGDGLPAEECALDAGTLTPIAAKTEPDLGIPERALIERIVDQ